MGITLAFFAATFSISVTACKLIKSKSHTWKYCNSVYCEEVFLHRTVFNLSASQPPGAKKFSIVFFRRSTLVGQRPMKSHSSLCLSARPSACPSLSFLETRSLVFSDVVYDDS